MLEQPNLQDHQIITSLRQSYAIPVTSVEFLPLGNDSAGWVYCVHTAEGTRYFLKIKNIADNDASLMVPRYLKDRGVEQVVAPLATTSEGLWADVDGFTMILYPFIEGQMAAEKGMSESQWVEFGQVLKQIHSTPLSPELLRLLPRETFMPKWGGLLRERDVLRELQAQIERSDTNAYQSPYEAVSFSF